MTKERLQVLSLGSLQEIADRTGVAFESDVDRDVLIDQILEAMEEDRNDRESYNNTAMRVKEKKFEIARDEEFEPRTSDKYPLPTSYNETKVALLLRDPLWAFAYWDLKQSDIDSLVGGRTRSKLLLRVHEKEPGEITEGQTDATFDIPVKNTDRSWYINLPRTGKSYHIELVRRTGASERVLCTSNVVDSPKASLLASNTSESESSFMGILAVSGIQGSSASELKAGIPQRIISLLDTQYLHLQG